MENAPIKVKRSMDTFYSLETDTDKDPHLTDDEPVEYVVHEQEPPNGGWGWVVTFSAFYINLIIIGTHNCFGILYLDLVDAFGTSLSETAWVGSIAFGCILIFAPLSGYLSNRFGCRIISCLGVLLASGSLFLSAYATSIPILYLTYGFGYGFGTSLCYMQGSIMIARYFSTRRALASGAGLAGSTLGALVMAPFYDALKRCLGWRTGLKVIAALTMTCLICAATYRPLRQLRRPSQVEKVKNSPARKFVLELSLWKNKAFVVWAIAVGLCKIGYLVPWVHMVKLAEDMSPRSLADAQKSQRRLFGSQLLQYMGVAATISRLFVGKIADSPRVNRLYLSQVSASLMGVVNIVQAYTRTYAGLLFYAILLGLLDGGVEILLPVMTLDLVGAQQLAIAWGCILAVISVSSIGPPVAGAIRDSTDVYLWAFYFAGVPMILSAVVLFLIPMWARQQSQNPNQSIMDINPSEAEIREENSKPKLFPGLTRALGRLCGGKKKRRPTESRGRLVQFQNEDRDQTGDSDDMGSGGTNKQFSLPGSTA